MARTRNPIHSTSPPSARPAFSLLELIVTLVILAAVAAIAAPRYANSLTRYRADLAARRVVADLALARAKAQEASAGVEVEFELDDNEVTISGVEHLDRTSQDYTTDLAAEPYWSQLVSANLGGDAKVTFDGYGVPDSGGTIGIRSGGEQRTIVLDADSGEATVQ